jgi:ABC-type nickel/cobalt efflux system permease component RcnA
MEFLFDIQRWIQDSLSREMSAYATSGDPALLAALIPLGIAFGAVHALTPGHSKTVLASYIAGSRLAYLRGVAVAGTLALVHVFSAVLIAMTAAALVTRTLGGVGRAPLLEDLSRGILILIGIWLLARALRRRTHPHGEGFAVAVVAGLIPCPLTLFAMFFAYSRGVPEAGFAFALSMMIGVATTLSLVAALTILARERVLAFMASHGSSAEQAARWLDGLAGAALIAIDIRQLMT